MPLLPDFAEECLEFFHFLGMLGREFVLLADVVTKVVEFDGEFVVGWVVAFFLPGFVAA